MSAVDVEGNVGLERRGGVFSSLCDVDVEAARRPAFVFAVDVVVEGDDEVGDVEVDGGSGGVPEGGDGKEEMVALKRHLEEGAFMPTRLRFGIRIVSSGLNFASSDLESMAGGRGGTAGSGALGEGGGAGIVVPDCVDAFFARARAGDFCGGTGLAGRACVQYYETNQHHHSTSQTNP